MSLESFRTVWKVSGQSGKFLGSLESFRTVWKVSGLSGKFLDSLESFWTVRKVSGQSGKFPGSLESFWIWEKFPKKTPFFRQHLKMHSSEQSNKHNQCDFASSKAGNLMRHLKTHSEKVTYASFRADPSRKYLKTHSGVKSNK